ncbi:MAG TPA: hypothetical protein VIV58_17915 [Kofleriaceae bacterium]
MIRKAGVWSRTPPHPHRIVAVWNTGRAPKNDPDLFSASHAVAVVMRQLGHPTSLTAGAFAGGVTRMVSTCRSGHDICDVISAELIAAAMSSPTSLARSALRARAKARPSRSAAGRLPRPVFEVFCEVAPRAQRFWEVCSLDEKESFESFPLRRFFTQ